MGGKGGLCVTAVGCLSCHGYILASMVCVLLLHCPGTVLSCHFWSHRKDSSSCASENCATHTSITHTHTHTHRDSVTCVCVPRQLFALLVSSPSKGLSLPLVAASLGGNTTSSAESIQRTAAVFEQ